MSKVTIRDFLLKLGFDSRDVDRGLKRVDSEVMKLNKKIQNQATTLNRVNNKNAQHQAKKIRDIRTENNLLSKQKNLVEGIAKPRITAKAGMSEEQIELRRMRQRASLGEQGRNLGLSASGIGTNRTSASLRKELETIPAKLVALRQGLRQLEEESRTATTKKKFTEIQIEMQKVRGETNRLLRTQRMLTQELQRQSFVANGLRDSMRNLARSYVSVFAVIGGGAAAGGIGQSLVQARTTLLAAYGNATEAGEAFEFVKEQAKALGIDLIVATKGFSRISIAAKNMGLSVAEAQTIFKSAAEASTAFGLSTDDTQGVMRAFDQIMSKGVVSMEELRQQLGDRLTGAFYIAAEAMGYTSAEFNKLVSSGGLASKDFMVPFAEKLRSAAREGNALAEGLKTSTKAMQRFGTSFKLNVLEAFDAGAEKGLSDFFNSLSALTEDAAPAFRILGKVVGTLLSVLGTVLQAIYQVFRPLAMLVDLFFSLNNSLDNANSKTKGFVSSMSSLEYVLRTIAGLIILPFAVLERMLDSVQAKMDMMRKNKISAVDFVTDIGKDIGQYGLMIGGAASNMVGLHGVADTLYGQARSIETSKASYKVEMGDTNITVEAGSTPAEIQSIIEKEWDWKIQSALVGDN